MTTRSQRSSANRALLSKEAISPKEAPSTTGRRPRQRRKPSVAEPAVPQASFRAELSGCSQPTGAPTLDAPTLDAPTLGSQSLGAQSLGGQSLGAQTACTRSTDERAPVLQWPKALQQPAGFARLPIFGRSALRWILSLWPLTTGGQAGSGCSPLTRAWRWLGAKYTISTTKRLRVSETVSLGEKRFVAIVAVEGREFLIGGGAAGVSMLAPLDAGAGTAVVAQQELGRGGGLL